MKQFILSLLLLPTCLAILHSQKREIIQLSDSDKDVYTFTISADRQLLYYANESRLSIFDLTDNKLVSTYNIKTNSPVTAIQAHPNTHILFIGTKSGKLVTISTDTGEELSENDYKSGRINALALTSDERSILVGCENGMVYMQSIKDENGVTDFYQHEKSITSIEVSKSKQLIAISSGDGSISLFREPTYESINKLFVEKDWVRKVVINENKDRLLCVGDDGYLYEWSIATIEKSRLLSKKKVSGNWLLSLDIGSEGDVECWGGLDHVLKAKTGFATYTMKLKGPPLKTEFITDPSTQISIVVCVLGKGIQIIPLREMKYRSSFK